MGALAQGQVYVSRLLDHSPDPDRHGWWLIAYNHRYGFINCRRAPPIGQRLPPACAAPPAVLPRAPTPCGTAPLSATVTATAPAIEIAEPATITTPSGTVPPTATVTGAVPLTASMTDAVLTTATVTITGTASPQAETATATMT